MSLNGCIVRTLGMGGVLKRVTDIHGNGLLREEGHYKQESIEFRTQIRSTSHISSPVSCDPSSRRCISTLLRWSGLVCLCRNEPVITVCELVRKMAQTLTASGFATKHVSLRSTAALFVTQVLNAILCVQERACDCYWKAPLRTGRRNGRPVSCALCGCRPRTVQSKRWPDILHGQEACDCLDANQFAWTIN